MAKYHDISSEIWEDLLELPLTQKALYIYLFSNPLCRPSGLYVLKQKTMEYYTGCKVEDLRQLFEAPCRPPVGPLVMYDENTSEIWVRGKLKHFRKLKDNWPLRKSVETDLELLKSPLLRKAFLKKYSEVLGEVLRGPIGPIRQGQRQGLKEKREEHERREKHFSSSDDGLTRQQRQNLKQLEEFRNERTRA